MLGYIASIMKLYDSIKYNTILLYNLPIFKYISHSIIPSTSDEYFNDWLYDSNALLYFF